MSKKRGLEPVSEEQQKQWQREARLQYDPNVVNDSIQLWNSYDKEKQEAIKEEGNQIYVAFADAIDAGLAANDEKVQQLVQKWHQHLRYFYEPSIDMIQGLGQMYSTSPDFMETFGKIHPKLADYLTEAITEYADELETAAISRLLAEDEDDSQQQASL